jgi:hypothetical protein
MDEERPEKGTIRTLWIEEALQRSTEYPDDEGTLYLTLCGGEGREISLLAERGLIGRTEIGAINEADRHRVVAVESSSLNYAKLRRKFPGLKILEVPFQSIVRGEGPTRWPSGDDEQYCRARIINLDFNDPLKSKEEEDGAVVFPVIIWIEKLARLHAEIPRRDWSLCLTLNGGVVWSEAASIFTQHFLAENFTREERFANSCRRFLGEELFEQIRGRDPVSFTALSRTVQQQVLMAVVPKLITRTVHGQGWRIQTEKNLRYGGPDHAPMVTWVVRFTWDPAGLATPDRIYRDGIASILQHAGVIEEDGNIALDDA